MANSRSLCTPDHCCIAYGLNKNLPALILCTCLFLGRKLLSHIDNYKCTSCRYEASCLSWICLDNIHLLFSKKFDFLKHPCFETQEIKTVNLRLSKPVQETKLGIYRLRFCTFKSLFLSLDHLQCVQNICLCHSLHSFYCK